MWLKSIKPSTNKDKKYTATFCMCEKKDACCGTNYKKVHFGAKGMSDYTKHKDDERKERYLDRHRANENWNSPTTAGALSRWILWNKKTLRASIEDFKKRFNL